MTTAETQGDTRTLSLGISVEAIEQFQVETNGSKAMHEGQGAGNFVLKSGGNQFHGGVYEYFRNTVLDARGFVPPVRPIEHQSEFGGSIGGPIIKNRVFFFGNYYGYRYVSASIPTLQSIPTPDFRNGNFSALPALIYDPATTATSAAGVSTRLPFPTIKFHRTACPRPLVVTVVSSSADKLEYPEQLFDTVAREGERRQYH